MKTVILDWATMCFNSDLSPEIFKEFGDISVFQLTSPNCVAKRIGNAEIVLCNKVQITKEIMDKCSDLRYIGLFATGFNNIDIEYAARKGITVCNAGQYSTDAVAQQVFAYILDFCCRIRSYDSIVRKGKWEKAECFSYFPISTAELKGKTLSIIGFGSIGKRTAAIGNAFGMRVLVNTRTVPENCPYDVCDLDTVVKNADFLTLHCPLTNETKSMINADFLSKMKHSAVLINTSRGAVVNEQDLADALNSKRLAMAYLDVLEKEPMSPDTPLKHAENCVITPHTSWSAHETRIRLLNIVRENIRCWINGIPQNKVN